MNKKENVCLFYYIIRFSKLYQKQERGTAPANNSLHCKYSYGLPGMPISSTRKMWAPVRVGSKCHTAATEDDTIIWVSHSVDLP